MFGVGLADDECVPALLAAQLDPPRQVHNLAVGGWGPHQMLALLERGRVEELVEEPPAAVVYWAIPHHVERVAGRADWDTTGPRYVLDADGGVVRAGSLLDAPASRRSGRSSLAKRSWYVRRVRARRRKTRTDEDVATWVGVVRAAAEEVEARFPGCTFIVLMSDLDRADGPELANRLEAAGLEVLRASDLFEGVDAPEQGWRYPVDGHPTPEAARVYASALAVRLEG
ncbi:MAG: hypothetical protein AAGB93_16610 [Planctomycetota bacterium]